MVSPVVVGVLVLLRGVGVVSPSDELDPLDPLQEAIDDGVHGLVASAEVDRYPTGEGARGTGGVVYAVAV